MHSEGIKWLTEYMQSKPNGYSRVGFYLQKLYPDLYNHIMCSWDQPSQPKHFVERVYQYLHPTSVVCPYGNIMKFEYYTTGYKCRRECQCSKEKKTRTMLDRHGVEYALQSTKSKEKLKSTLFSRYGVETVHAAGSDKRKSTMLSKYGVEHALQSKDIQGKTRSTLYRQFGVEYPFQSNIIQQQSANTIAEKYGVSCVLALPENQDKARKAIKSKYGVKSVFSLPGVREKISKTYKSRYGSHPSQRHIVPEKVNQLHDDVFFSEVYSQLKSVDEVMKFFGVKATTVHRRAKRLGLPRKKTSVSLWEAEVADYIKSLNFDIDQSNRTIIKPKEIDIVIHDKKIGIEFDGIYNHSERFITDTKLHLFKTLQAQRSGYRLIHIFSDEWIYKKEIVKSRLSSILGVSGSRIPARKTSIVEIDTTVAKSFLEENHIQGWASSSVNLGLYYRDCLVAVMTFGAPRFDKSADYELIRFCNRLDCTVVGGASKLLAHFCNGRSGRIISYADRRWSDGNLYKQIGFGFVRETEPGYQYVVGTRRESRHRYQKHKLSQRLKIFNPSKSEVENMRDNNFYRIFDCGNTVWCYNIKED